MSGSPQQPARTAFLFNSHPHHVLHGITIAQALAENWQTQVDVLAATTEHLQIARSIIGHPAPPKLAFKLIKSSNRSWDASWRRGIFPLNLLTLTHAKHLLDAYDAIVLPDAASAIIRRLGIIHPKLIYIGHGAGDGAAGFNRQIAQFDFALLAGEKQRRRMLDEKLIRPGAYAVTGYPKFEAATRMRDANWTPFGDTRRIVLYNPHYAPKLSSWDRDGMTIIDKISKDRNFNLIVAPHMNMCDTPRKRAMVSRRLAAYSDLPNVHVDLGSYRSMDMTYLNLADIYVGDVGGQVYEYLQELRPAIFIDSHNKYWVENSSYNHWHFGVVLDSSTDIISSLYRSLIDHKNFEFNQRLGFTDTFSEFDETPSLLSAKSIAAFMEYNLQ